MKLSLFSFALALTCSASALAAPVKATPEQLAVLKRATAERLAAVESALNERIVKEEKMTPASCDFSKPSYYANGRYIDLEEAQRAIGRASEVWVDEGAQPVLMFQTNSAASRLGEVNKIVRIISNAEQSAILSVSVETIVYQDVLGGSISRPSYTLSPQSTMKRCLMKVAKIEDVVQKSPVLK